MRVLIPALLVLAACGPGEADRPGKTPLPVLRAVRLAEKERVEVDASMADEAWKRARELVVGLEGEGPARVRLKAAYDDERIYLLAVWPDPSRSLNRYWKYVDLGKWQRHTGEDAFSLCWSPERLGEAFGERGCALFCHGEKHVYPGEESGHADFLFWGAQSTSYFGQARDMWLPFGPRQRLRGDSQPEGSDNQPNLSTEYEGPAGVRWKVTKESSRFLPRKNAQLLTRERLVEKLDLERNLGWEVPLDILRPMKGSRADVVARGRHLEKAWVLELTRARDTSHRDDRPLTTERVRFAVAIHDGTEKGAHSVSGPIELHLVPNR